MNRKAIVLGGYGDIGSAIVSELNNKMNCNAIAVGRKNFDLSDISAIDDYIAKNGNEFEILIHSAGLNVPKNFDELTLKEIQHSLDANLIGFLYFTHKLLPFWKRIQYGRIVVVLSLYSIIARGGRLPYVVSKHALFGAVKTLAIELAPYNVLVNAVSPGYIDTKMTTQNNSIQTISRFTDSIPIGRLGTPNEVAKAICFFASEDNTYITGSNLVVDGGYSIGGFQ